MGFVSASLATKARHANAPPATPPTVASTGVVKRSKLCIVCTPVQDLPLRRLILPAGRAAKRRCAYVTLAGPAPRAA